MVLQLQIDICERDEAEHISDLLSEAGAVSVTMTDKKDDPILEPDLGTTPLWPEVVIQALYPEMAQAELALMLIAAHFPWVTFQLDVLPEQDWDLVCKSEFKPLQFGNHLWICPSWIPPPNLHAINLILDPGLAFGTGTHSTTALCLTWLDSASIEQQRVIDYGCGSGILALAALKLGAQHAYAVDIDEQALIATRSNAEVNQIAAPQLTVSFPNNLQQPVELILANILLSPLLSLQQRFHQLLKPNGTLVVSGILEEQIATVVEAYTTHFLLQSTETQDGWALVSFSRRI